MPGLGNTDDATFVSTMQQVNLSIVNPAFMLSFIGAPLLAATGVAVSDGPGRPWAIAALVLAIGTVVVTAGFNVPLNDALAAVDPTAGVDAVRAAREAFENSWVRWNVVRALTSTAALGCFGLVISRSA